MQKELTLNDKILKAALSLTEGDLKRKFTAEELLVNVWNEDNSSFGLRGFEEKHPDSNKLYTKLDGKDGIVKKGIFKKVGERIYVLTEAGLSIAMSLGSPKEEYEIKLERSLQTALSKIINHEIFLKWLKSPDEPKRFREAGWFWGIAPGTPPNIVKGRLQDVEKLLNTAKEHLKKKGAKKVIEQHGKVLFDKKMLEKCSEFHKALKERFKKDLEILLRE